MIARAVLAPSSHNTQPWRFDVSGSRIDLYAERGRALPVNDPQDRELAISCGCALLNLRIAAASLGLGVQVELLPGHGQPDHLARVTFSEHSNGHEDAALAKFMESRRTYRKRFAPQEVDEATEGQLVTAAKQEGARFLPLASVEARRQAADLVAEGDAAQWADPGWRRELAAWMRTRSKGDGLSIPAIAVPLTRFFVRSFDLGSRVGEKDRQLALDSPLLAVLATDGDHARDWLQAGQALERTLLVSCKHGLQASFLNQPIQVAALRPRLRELAAGGFPQILLRIGYPGDDISPAPRRALDEVISSGHNS